MRHSNSGRKLSRTPSHRKALLHNLAKALLIHGKIRTTEMKAKELRSIVEPLITLGKRNDLHSRRLAYRVLNDHALVKRLFDEIAPLYANIAGGYTRIEKFAMPRKGDNAPMALIELTQRADAPKADDKPASVSAPEVASDSKAESAQEKPKKAAPKKAKAETASASGEEAPKPKRTRKPKAEAEASEESK